MIFNLIDKFLFVYLYCLEKKLNIDGLVSLRFQSQESNIDEELKRFIKKFILKNSTISEIDVESITFNIEKESSIVELQTLLSYSINRVLLPEELTLEFKKSLKKDGIVYTNPDLLLEITEGESKFYRSLKLKSTKANNIPGSSIQQVDPHGWVIFAKRDEFKIRSYAVGLYINGIKEELPFPDRSPRPMIGYNNLENWNKEHIIKSANNLVIDFSEVSYKKIEILTNWHSFLSKEWLALLKTDRKANEKWFYIVLREFSVNLLDYYDSLTEVDKKEFKNKNDISKVINKRK